MAIVIYIIFWMTSPGVRSSSSYTAWNGRTYPVYITKSNELVIVLGNGTIKNFENYVNSEIKNHPCRFNDGFRAAPGKNICNYHIR